MTHRKSFPFVSEAAVPPMPGRPLPPGASSLPVRGVEPDNPWPRKPSRDAVERLESAVMVSVIRAVLPLVADRPPEKQACHVLDIYDCIIAEREKRRHATGV